LSASQSFYDDGALAPVGLTCSLFAVFLVSWRRSTRNRPGSEVSTPSSSSQRLTLREILSQALAPLQSFTNTPPWETHLMVLAIERLTHPFRGFFPFSVLPAARSYLPPVSFHLTGYVAPLGFLTPSTPCSPHDLPGLFHPGPAPGFFPSRLCSPRNAVHPFGCHDPHAVGCDAEHHTAAPGLYSFRRSQTLSLGFSQGSSWIPPWDCTPPRFLARPA
jgi:hypothetical protein